MASYRLNKVAKDLNVGIKTLAEYLAKKGHQVDDAPNTKINEAQYELLTTAFQSERKVKEMSLQEKKPKPRPKRVMAPISTAIVNRNILFIMICLKNSLQLLFG